VGAHFVEQFGVAGVEVHGRVEAEAQRAPLERVFGSMFASFESKRIKANLPALPSLVKHPLK